MERTYVGETKVMDNGREATIIEFRDFYDIDVQLSTGEIAKHQQYIDFQRCDSAALGFYKEPIVNKSEEKTISNNSILLYHYLQID